MSKIFGLMVFKLSITFRAEPTLCLGRSGLQIGVASAIYHP